MKDSYDFSNAKRGAVAPTKGKSRITIMLDDTVIKAARERAEEVGIGYQTLINSVLREALGVTPPAAKRGKALSSNSELPLSSFNRHNVAALEAQLNDMAKSLHALLSEGSEVS